MDVLVAQFNEIEDAYLRERQNDVMQVVERVLKRLMGRPGALPAASSEEQTILVAHDHGLDDLAEAVVGGVHDDPRVHGDSGDLRRSEHSGLNPRIRDVSS